MKTLLLLLLSSPLMAQTVLRYEGYIENTGVPVNATSQSFSVSVMMQGCATALTSTSATADIVDGEFNIAPSYADATLFSQIMNPSYTNGSCPTANSNRIMRIVWSGQTFDIAMNDAARSSFSGATSRLGDRSQDEFLKIVSNPGQAPLSVAQVSTLLDLITGTSVQYLQPTSNFTGDVSGTSATTVVARIRGTNVVATAPTVNQILKFDGTNWAPAADDAGVATDASYAAKGIIQVNTDATTSGLSLSAGILSMPNVGTAGTYGSASLVPVMTTDAKGRVTAVVNTAVNDTTKLPLAGGTMTGAIDMGLQNMTNATTVAATNFSGRNLLLNDNDSNTALIRVPTDITANYTLTLPADDGSAGQVLTTDGAGVLSWSATATGDITDVVAGVGLTGGAASGGATLNVNTGIGPNQIVQLNGTSQLPAVSGVNLTNLNADNIASGTLPITRGGTGALTASAAINNLLPTQATNAGRVLSTDGTNTSWITPSAGSVVSVSSVNSYLSVANGTTTPTITLNIGTASNTVAAGDDSRITGALQSSAYNADLASAATCTSVQMPYWNTVSDLWACQNISSRIPTSIVTPSVSQTGQSLRWNNTTTQWEWYTPSVYEAYLNMPGISVPAASAAGEGRIYFDNASNIFRVSQNGSTYQNLVNVRFPADTTPGASIAIGENALASQVSASFYNNIAIGRNVLDSVTSGSSNVGIGGDGGTGDSPLSDLSSGIRNSVVGSGAGARITSGNNNTVYGAEAYSLGTTGTNNSFVGYNSGGSATSSSNTAVGANSLVSSTGTGINSAFGSNSLQLVTTGTQNTAIGAYAGNSISNGSYNTTLGVSSGSAITSGIRNLILGHEVSSTNLTTGSHNILIGTSLNIDTPTPSTNYHLNIGDVLIGSTQPGSERLSVVTNSMERLTIDNVGNVGIGTASPAARLDVNGAAIIGVGSSTLSKVIFCNPTVSISANLITAGDSINLQSAGSSCPGVLSGMVVNCSWASETSPLGRLSWTTILTNATDQTNNAIRIRFTNQATSGTLPLSATTLGLACIAYMP